MAEEEFLSAITMCRILPGANQVNLAVFVGAKFRGVLGAIAAVDRSVTAFPCLSFSGSATLIFSSITCPRSRACFAVPPPPRLRSR